MSDITVNGLVNQIMQQYDHDRNGKIEVEKDETYFVKNGFWSSDNYRNGNLINDINTHTNQDGVVTKEEVFHFVKNYDVNGDNNLDKRSFIDKLLRRPKGELEDFESNYKEVKDNSKKLTKIPTTNRFDQPDPPSYRTPVYYNDPFDRPYYYDRPRYKYPEYDYSPKRPVYSDPFDKPTYGGGVYDDPFKKPSHGSSVYDDPFDKPAYGGSKSGSVYDDPFN